MKRLLPLKILLISALIAACVTINVYFPAAAAEKVADKVIDTVTRHDDAPAATPAAKPPTSGITPRAAEWPQQFASRLLGVFVASAHAQNADLDISSPEVRALTASMQQRFGQLEKFFQSGAVGLTANGMIAVREQSAVSLADRALVARLVAEDNKDRAALYAEIARANGHPEWEGDIQRTFARRWIERGAQPGWYYQDAGGAWKQK